MDREDRSARRAVVSDYAIAHGRDDSLVVSQLRVTVCGAPVVRTIVSVDSLGPPPGPINMLLYAIARDTETSKERRQRERMTRVLDAQSPGRFCDLRTPCGEELSVDVMRKRVAESRVRGEFIPRASDAMSVDARWPLRLTQRPDTARWPEAATVPSLRQGPFFAMLGTTASMIAFLNNLVAGAAVTLGVSAVLGHDRLAVALGAGIAVAAILMAMFISYQTRRFEALQQVFESAGK